MTPSGFLNVLLLGADPTGVVNSTTAITNACTRSKNVYIPPGTYKVASTITIPQDGVFILGSNRAHTILKASATGPILSASGKTDIIVEGLTLDINNFNGACFIFSDCTGLVLRGNRFMCTDSGSAAPAGQSLGGIQQGAGTGCVRTLVTDNHFSRADGHGLVLSLGQEAIVTNNRMDDIGWAGVNCAGVIGATISNNTIVGNVSTGDAYGGIRVCDDSRSIAVTGNMLQNNRSGLMLLGCAYVAAAGNTIRNSQYYGIWVATNSNNPQAYVTAFNTVSCNTVYNPWTVGVAVNQYAVTCSGANNGTEHNYSNTISSNIITDDRGPAHATHAIVNDTGGQVQNIVNNISNLIYANGS